MCHTISTILNDSIELGDLGARGERVGLVARGERVGLGARGERIGLGRGACRERIVVLRPSIVVLTPSGCGGGSLGARGELIHTRALALGDALLVGCEYGGALSGGRGLGVSGLAAQHALSARRRKARRRRAGAIERPVEDVRDRAAVDNCAIVLHRRRTRWRRPL